MLAYNVLLVIQFCHSVDRYCRGVSLTKIWVSLLTKMLTVVHFVRRGFRIVHYTLWMYIPSLSFVQRYLSTPCKGQTDATNVASGFGARYSLLYNSW